MLQQGCVTLGGHAFDAHLFQRLGLLEKFEDGRTPKFSKLLGGNMLSHSHTIGNHDHRFGYFFSERHIRYILVLANGFDLSSSNHVIFRGGRQSHEDRCDEIGAHLTGRKFQRGHCVQSCTGYSSISLLISAEENTKLLDNRIITPTELPCNLDTRLDIDRSTLWICLQDILHYEITRVVLVFSHSR